jgi:hypothetical protein
MAGRLALRKRANDKRIGMIGKRLAEVHTAGLFLYGGEDVGVEMDDLFGAREPIWEREGVGT